MMRSARDYPMLQGTVLFIATIFALVNCWLTCYAYLDRDRTRDSGSARDPQARAAHATARSVWATDPSLPDRLLGAIVLLVVVLAARRPHCAVRPGLADR